MTATDSAFFVRVRGRAVVPVDLGSRNEQIRNLKKGLRNKSDAGLGAGRRHEPTTPRFQKQPRSHGGTHHKQQ